MSQCHDVYPAVEYVSSEARSVQGAPCHDAPYQLDDRCVEVILANAVRDWAEKVAPGDERTVRAAVETAIYLFASGASVSEACEEARVMVRSRLRHPSHERRVHDYAEAS